LVIWNEPPKRTTMNQPLQLDARLADQVRLLGRPLEEMVPALIVLELFRRGQLSSGKAAELLDMGRLEFIRYAARMGLPYFDLTEAAWAAEIEQMKPL
jgi:predicted HTH domain antitoxin